MITAVHTVVFSAQPEAVRAFFQDVLALPSVDGGGGWPIFALPPGELGVHPAEGLSHELYLMCDDLDATVAELAAKGVAAGAVQEERWGRITRLTIPGTEEQLTLYQPSHPSPLNLPQA
jgi:hypothetical protein